MGDDSSHVEAETSSISSNTPLSPLPLSENTDILTPSFSQSSAPSSRASTLGRLTLKSPTSPIPSAPGSPADRGQVSAITVVALLDKLVNMMEVVQDNQQRMEQRQADLEGAVRTVQGDVTRLSKTHVTTSNSVGKLLERSRKVSGHLKDVRERMDKQAVQVKRLEANHSHLLKRNHFKVLIFQDDNEIPSSVLVKDSLKTSQLSQLDEVVGQPAALVTGSIDGSRCQEEGLQTISLSSDEEDDGPMPLGEDAIAESDALPSLETTHTFERSRADKLKRSSLKKVDSLKKAFSRESFEKKMNKISTKIAPQERLDKIKKSFTPNHPKSSSTKSSSFKVSPMTFNVKKVRDSDVPMQDGGSPEDLAHVEITALDSRDGELLENLVEEGGDVPGSSSPESVKVDVVLNGDAEMVVNDLDSSRPAGLAPPEHNEDVGQEEKEVAKEQEQEEQEIAVDVAADAKIPASAITVEQAS